MTTDWCSENEILTVVGFWKGQGYVSPTALVAEFALQYAFSHICVLKEK